MADNQTPGRPDRLGLTDDELAVHRTAFASDDDLTAYMIANKTTCALKLFEAPDDLALPAYITAAVQ